MKRKEPVPRDFGPLKSDVRQREPTPFLKWAGGKGQLLEQMEPFFPSEYGTYFEPFLGGGAVFFHLRPRTAILSDLNPDLIAVFLAVRDHPDAFMAALDRHRPKRNDSGYYYRVRSLDPAGLNPVERAARAVFLNKTCFNGLYRVNSKGAFNVPFGRYRNPTLYDPGNIWAASEALRGKVITLGDFREICEYARKDDFVYLDPPYQPISATSAFTAYTKGLFGQESQQSLAAVFKMLDERGAKVMLSNSSTDFIRSLYTGFRTKVLRAARAINCKGTGRGAIDELLIMNF